MRVLISVFCLGGALLLIMASMLMNWTFWTGQGVDTANDRVFGAVSLGIDVFKTTLPLVIAWSWAGHFRLGGIIATIFFGGCLLFSLFSAIGFASSSRDAVTGSRTDNALRYGAAERDLKDVQTRLVAVGSTRPQGVIMEAIGKAEQDRRWLSSDHCKDATAETSLSYCRNLGDLRIELASSVESDRLQDQASTLKTEMDRLLAAGAKRETDPQAGILARLSGLQLKHVQSTLVLLLALLVELGAAFGLFLAMLPLRSQVGFERERGSNNPTAEILPPARRKRPKDQGPTRFVRSADGRLMIE